MSAPLCPACGRAARWALIVALGLAWVPAASAQGRGDLINRARAEFSDSVGFELLLSAADPNRGALDSLWTVSVHEIALKLIGSNNAGAATTWLRWSARHGGQWPIDRSFFPPALVGTYDGILGDVRSSPEPGDAAITRWRWPTRFDPGATGSIEVATRTAGGAFLATVEGAGQLRAGSSLALRPGSYNLLLAADGYESVRMTREILPGATTVLEVDLRPMLPGAPAASVNPPQVAARRGGFPIKWVGAGALAAGAAFFLTKGGGGGGTTATEGDVIFTIPTGS